VALGESGSIESIRARLDVLVEARLHGLTPAEEREYRDLVEREATLLGMRSAGTTATIFALPDAG
jgi:hypothetical protein